MYLADITIRIEETLDKDCASRIAGILLAESGVENVWVQDASRHLVMVEFDAETLEPSAIVRSIQSRGLHAATFGL